MAKKPSVQDCVTAIETFTTQEQLQVKKVIEIILADKEKAAADELDLLKGGNK
jgi:hypothetical protein